MKVEKNNYILPIAKRLRKEMTPHERKLWYMFLRRYPVKIYKQRIISSFIVDFYCADAKIVIELDGSQHYENRGKEIHKIRDSYLNSLGLKVLRYSNSDVNKNFSGVCEDILKHISTSSTNVRWSPFPSRGRQNKGL